MSVSTMISEISSFIDEDPGKFYRVVIGSDSQARHVNSHAEIDFVTAVIVHRTGRGARYFWKKQKEIKDSKKRLLMFMTFVTGMNAWKTRLADAFIIK